MSMEMECAARAMNLVCNLESFHHFHSIDFQINSVLIPDCEIGQKTIQQLVV